MARPEKTSQIHSPMWNLLSSLAIPAIAVFLGYRFFAAYRKERARKRDAPELLFAKARQVLDDARYETAQSIGYPPLVGRYGGLPVRIQAIVDTLAVRKLPALWLIVTIPEPLPLRATFDLMMRPAGTTTFSNFDRLAEIIGCPPDFPEQGLVRSDDAGHALPPHVVAPHLDIFSDGRAKELLITPKGLRFVWRLAEADRLRYGVFRQAEFGDVTIDEPLLRELLNRLTKLRADILDWAGKPA